MQCDRCGFETANVRCRCGRYLTDDAHLVNSIMPMPACNLKHIEIALLTSHWGDVMAAWSIALMVMDRLGQAECDVLYWGPDQAIADFLKVQPHIRRVFTARKGLTYWDFLTAFKIGNEDWRYLLPVVYGIDPEKVWIGGNANNIESMQTQIHPPEFELPIGPLRWAQDYLTSLFLDGGDDVVLLHPSSTWSASPDMHWPLWTQSISWLLDNTPNRYLITGCGDPQMYDGARILSKHHRLIDARGELPTNMENFALASILGRVITTCNSVAIYCAANSIPSVVVGHSMHNESAYVYRRLMERNKVVPLKYSASIEDFADAVHAIGIS